MKNNTGSDDGYWIAMVFPIENGACGIKEILHGGRSHHVWLVSRV